MAPYILLTAIATLLLVTAEWYGYVPGRWLAKPVASLGFILTALAAGATSSSYGIAILVALVFCLVGDLLLMPSSRRTFVLGLGSFLAGHIVFAAAFSTRGLDRFSMLCGLAVLVLLAIVVMRWLSPHITGSMRIAVAAYILAIVAMASAACGTFGASPEWRILAGAAAFLISDLAVARERFVEHSRMNRVAGLPLYYAAQLLLASSV